MLSKTMSSVLMAALSDSMFLHFFFWLALKLYLPEFHLLVNGETDL